MVGDQRKPRNPFGTYATLEINGFQHFLSYLQTMYSRCPDSVIAVTSSRVIRTASKCIAMILSFHSKATLVTLTSTSDSTTATSTTVSVATHGSIVLYFNHAGLIYGLDFYNHHTF